MGRPKPLLPLDGGTFLSHLLEQIEGSKVDSIVIVLGHHPEIVLQSMPQIEHLAIRNENYQLGQLSSLRVGLDEVGTAEAALLCLADHPFITTEVIDAVLEGFETTRKPI